MESLESLKLLECCSEKSLKLKRGDTIQQSIRSNQQWPIIDEKEIMKCFFLYINNLIRNIADVSFIAKRSKGALFIIALLKKLYISCDFIFPVNYMYVF